MTSGTHNRIIHYFSQYCLIPISFVLLLSPGTLIAENTAFIPRASLPVAQYQFTPPTASEQQNNGTFPEAEFGVTLKSLGIGGALFKNSCCLNMLYLGSLNKNVSFSIEDPALPGGSFSNAVDGAHRDYTFTLGKKRLNGRTGLYTGYKVGKIDISQPLDQHLPFEKKGTFVGSNYDWLITDAIVLSLNVAYAKPDRRRSEKTILGFEFLGFSKYFKGTGVAKRLSYGANGSPRPADHTSNSIGLNVEEYTFKKITDPNISFTDEIEKNLGSITFST